MEIEIDDSALDFGGPVRYRANVGTLTGPWRFSEIEARSAMETELKAEWYYYQWESSLLHG